MSLFDSASLIVTPSGYKEDKLYSIKPSDGSGDLVVTRATTPTRVNSSGLIEVVPYNLLTYSNTFTNAIWTKDNVSLTSGITSPSGLNNAFKLVESATTGVHSIYQTFLTLPSSVYSTSIYVKKGERFKVAIADRNSGAYVSFNLNTETILASLSLVGTIELLNNDWYRLTAKTSSAISVYVPQIFILEDSYTTGVPITLPYAGNGTSGIFIYAAQFEAGATAKEYFPTTDRLDVPRLDYTNSSCPSILVEPQRTNVALRSEEFDNGYWEKYRCDLSANSQISPSGIQNADTFTSSVGQVSVPAIATTNITFLGNTRYSFSIYVKKIGTTDSFNLGYVDNSTGYTGGSAIYNLTTQSITITQSPNSSVNASMESVGNGWYRLILNFLTIATPTYNYIELHIRSTNTSNTFAIWGAQLEAGSYATSYIPTIASSVTRNADVISKTGISSLIGQTEGTIFADCFINTSDTTSTGICGISGTGLNFIYLFKQNGNILRANVFTTSQQVSLTYTFPNSNFYKIAFKYKQNQFSLFINGVKISSSNSGNVPACSAFNFYDVSLGLNPNGLYKSTCLFKTALTDDECINLTTI